MSVIKLKKGNFDIVKTSEKPVLIDFYADWCGPCRIVSSVIDEIADEHSDFLICKVNVDEETELASTFGVSGIPMLVVLKNGEIVNRSVGAKSKQHILDMLG